MLWHASLHAPVIALSAANLSSLEPYWQNACTPTDVLATGRIEQDALRHRVQSPATRSTEEKDDKGIAEIIIWERGTCIHRQGASHSWPVHRLETLPLMITSYG